MDLKSFLKWEEPIKVHTYNSAPQIYISQKSKDNTNYGSRLVFNGAWCNKFINDIPINKEGVGAAVSIDRENKFFVVMFAPPKNVPQFVAKQVWKKSTSVQIVNRFLLSDIWETLDCPPTVPKQFFEAEIFKQVEGKTLWKISYNPKSFDNEQIIVKSTKLIKK